MTAIIKAQRSRPSRDVGMGVSVFLRVRDPFLGREDADPSLALVQRTFEIEGRASITIEHPGSSMAGRKSDDEDDLPWRYPRRRRGPRRDLGPSASPTPSTSLHPAFTARLIKDAYTVDRVEHASVRAEEAVQPFLRARPEPWFAGRSIVTISFLDSETLASFRRTRAVRAVRTTRISTWRLVRRWADADGDGGLDEMMCRVVAMQLNGDFAGLLRAGVVTFIPPHAP